ncbi:MAG: hypothetical protein VXB01_01615 [Opitutae bacterium]
MAERPVGVSPDVQSILQDVAIAEAQRRMTLGQQMAAREQALRQARQLRGADVLRAMAQRSQMADRRAAAMQEIAEQRRLKQKMANILSGITSAGGTLLAAAPMFKREAAAQPGDDAFVGPLMTPEAEVAQATAEKRMADIFELGQLEAAQVEDPRERMRILREYANMAAMEGI